MDNAKSKLIISGESASLQRRLGAMVYDALLIIALWMLIGAFMLIFTEDSRITPKTPILFGAQRILFILTWCVFYLFFWWRDNQTLGMRAWNIYLVANDQKQLTMSQMLIRLLFSLISFLCCGLGFFWIFCNKNRSTWHDMISKTQVIYVPSNK